MVIFSASVENQIEREENAETLTAEWRYISRRTLASIEKIEKKGTNYFETSRRFSNINILVLGVII